ncbi:MaoC family dehydratase N-terminal domain-containing protein [Thermodesulfobacteriota bacterium]
MENESKVRMQDYRITEEMIEEMRGKTGLKLRIDHSVWNEEASRMIVLKFADGIGDSNPLWRDHEYAGKSKYGTIVAPPSWVFSVFAGIQFGWRGLGGFHNANDVEFFRPVLLDDKIRAECIYNGFDGPKSSKFAEKMITDFNETKYYNHRDELVATNKWNVMRFERGKARESGSEGAYDRIQLPHPWKEEELKEIEEEILSEEIRGSEVRYYEDVDVGQELPQVIKGPIGITDEIAFLIGGGAPIPRLAAHGVALRQYKRHPAWRFRDPGTHANEPVFAVHYHKGASGAMGLPMPYDVGFQRHCWQIQALTNWMSDDGWLKKSHIQLRRHVFLSDLIRLKGKVIKKHIEEDGQCCVCIETSAINQRGEEVMPGSAIIALPSRERGIWPVDEMGIEQRNNKV